MLSYWSPKSAVWPEKALPVTAISTSYAHQSAKYKKHFQDWQHGDGWRWGYQIQETFPTRLETGCEKRDWKSMRINKTKHVQHFHDIDKLQIQGCSLWLLRWLEYRIFNQVISNLKTLIIWKLCTVTVTQKSHLLLRNRSKMVFIG